MIATVALLQGSSHLSERLVREVLADLFYLDTSLGALVACQNLASAALEAPVSAAHEHIHQAPAVTGGDRSSSTPWDDPSHTSSRMTWVAEGARSIRTFDDGSSPAVVMNSPALGEGIISTRAKRIVVTRLWHLVHTLNQARQPRTIAQLTEELGVSRSTLYRDLETLERAHVALERVNVNGEARVGLKGLRTLAVTPSLLQVAALRLAREALAPLDGTALVREVDDLLAQWSHVESKAPRVSQRIAATGRSALVAVLDATMTGHRRLVLEYQGHDDEAARRREIDPLLLHLVHDQPYLFAFCHLRQDYRLFKVARIAAAHATDVPADDHSAVDLEALLAHSVKVRLGDPTVMVVVRLSPRTARFAAEYPLVPDQELEPMPDGSALVRARVTGTIEALRWVLGWGADAEAVAPQELRQAVRQELGAAAQLYTDGPIDAAAVEVVSRRADTGGARWGG
ncbi:MAG: transcriptional regulator [Polyangiaceae bacterium]|nr:transcriptional regulator [Polyangiaceae bacterium]